MPDPTVSFSLALLGGLKLTVDGADQSLAMRKAQVLLARLALAGPMGVGRDALCALLWEESGDAQARTSLRQALAHARRALGPAAAALEAGPERVALDTTHAEVDILTLERWREAPDGSDPTPLLRGEFLEGLAWREPAIGDWLAAQRQRAHVLTVEVLQQKAENLLAANALASALHLTMRALERDRLRESLHRTAMRIHAAQGEPTAAIRQYRQCASLLSRELGVRPEPETTALYEKIRASRNAPIDPVGDPSMPAMSGPSAATPVMVAMSREIREVSVLAALPPRSDDPEEMAETATHLATLGETVVAHHNAIALHSEDADLLLVFGLKAGQESDRARARQAAVEILAQLPSARFGIASGRVVFAPGPPPQITGEARRVAIGRAAGANNGAIEDGAPHHAGPTLASEFDAVLEETASRPSAPFIGRRLELAQLRAAAHHSAVSGTGTVVIVTGEPGIGKSRLGAEVSAHFYDEGGTILSLSFQSFGQAEPAVQRAGRQLCDFSEELPPADPARAAMRARALGTAQPPGGEALLAAMPKDHFASLAAEVTVELLRAAPGPSLIRVEDAHWADETELSFLCALADAIAATPTVMLVTERLGQARFGPHLARKVRRAETVEITLRPLAESDAQALAAALQHTEDPEAAICRAAGNPLFLLRLLQDGRDSEGMPPSVVSLVQEQIDGLPQSERQAIRQAAILGPVFEPSDYGLCFGAADFGSALFTGFLAREGSGIAFTHALVHEAVYSAITKADRMRLHTLVAAAFREHDPVKWAEHAIAGQTEDAAQACAAAADALLPRDQLAASDRFIEAGLALEGSADARAVLLHSRAGLKRERGDLNGALEDYRAASRAAQSDTIRAQTLARQAWVHRLRGDLHLGDDALASAAAVPAEKLGPDSLSELENQKGAQAFARGDHEGCLAHNKRALELAEAPLYRSRALGGMGDAHYASGRMRSAHESYRAAIDLARANGLGLVEMAHLGIVAASLGLSDPGPEALALANVAVERSAAAGNARGELIARQARAEILLHAGMLEDAGADLDAAEAIIVRIGARQFLTEVGFMRAELISLSGDEAASYALIRDTLKTAEGRPPSATAAAVHAQLARNTRDPVERRNAIAKGEACLAVGSLGHSHLWFRQLAAEALLREGDYDGADHHGDELAAYTSEEPLAWSDMVIRRIRLLARHGRGDTCEADAAEASALMADLEAALLKDSLTALRIAFPHATPMPISA
ncbi:MAG: AAA family ATPase [Devosia sp.]